MKRIGVVDNISYDGSIIIRADFAPDKGVHILDKRKASIGRVMKVFGPIKKPFAAVRPNQKPTLSLIGSEVYLEEGKHAGKKLKKDRRS